MKYFTISEMLKSETALKRGIWNDHRRRGFRVLCGVFFQKNEKNRTRYKFISYFCIVNDINKRWHTNILKMIPALDKLIDGLNKMEK